MSAHPTVHSHVTTLLLAWGNGDDGALEQLVPLVHRELRRLARRAMAGERADHTLQPTALVNEVYLRLVDMKSVRSNDRAHFFALSARLMRRILVDIARSRRYQKRGGGTPTICVDDAPIAAPARGEDLVALDEALDRLAAFDPRRSQVVELRFFGGLGVEEVAEVLKISRHTVMRDWTLARTWLFRELRRGTVPPATDAWQSRTLLRCDLFRRIPAIAIGGHCGFRAIPPPTPWRREPSPGCESEASRSSAP